MMYEQFISDFFSWFGISASSVIYKRLEFYERPDDSSTFTAHSSLLHLLYFSTYSGIKTPFLILNICCEHTTLVSVLQQS